MSETTVTSEASVAAPPAAADKQIIKCVVWDLDDTLWEGTLLEGDDVRLREGVAEIVAALDARGILQSVASKNDRDAALAKLRQFGLKEYFLHPQISWNSKAASIGRIAAALNIGADAVAFIDDQPYERAEVAYALPQVTLFDVADLAGLLDLPQLNPRIVTDNSRMRRRMYLSDIERSRVEEEFVGPKEEFLASLGMLMTVAPAEEDDLMRAEELTVRTNQLNTTGRPYSYEELDGFRRSERHQLLIAGLSDKFGSYGKIGLALVECEEGAWTIRLLLMSCRVMSRGVGSVLLSLLARRAKEAGVRLRADFVANERNRMMYVTYKFAGFREVSRGEGGAALLEHDPAHVQPLPAYVRVEVAG
ncbi:MAG: HAD-IIIC family phosphatase [Acidobacteria bacterium]|nr:HAD-IIIC family phosphatase [Acidobacteriota bacterium]